MMPHKNKGYDQLQNYASFAGFVSVFFSEEEKEGNEGKKKKINLPSLFCYGRVN